MINNNPFTSKLFSKIWCSHFNNSKPTYTFDFIEDITFYRPSFLPLYDNIGKNLTKGISYVLNPSASLKSFKNKVLLIYDVPKYFDIQTNQSPKKIGLKKIKQYPGFLINLENYDDFNIYFKNSFSKSSIQKLNRYNRRLETCFNISEKMLMGSHVKKSEYEFVFNYFHQLLTKRFEDKQITNNNLNPKEWLFYKEVAYPLLLDNKDALHVIYNENIPISVRLLYFSENTIFDAITVFDIDYTKFHIGKISIMKMLKWSFESNYKIFDFSKGYFDYKESWSDLKYDFEYHIFYNKTSITANIIATTLSSFFKLKQYLRDKEFNNILHKISFIFNNKKTNTISLIAIDKETINYTEDMLIEININDSNYSFLKKILLNLFFLICTVIKNE